MSSDRYWSGLAEINEVHDERTTNEYLAKGWELIKVSEMVNSAVLEGTLQLQTATRIIYVMGRFKASAATPAAAPPKSATSTPSGFQKPCDNCGQTIVLRKGQAPLNLDGTTHRD